MPRSYDQGTLRGQLILMCDASSKANAMPHKRLSVAGGRTVIARAAKQSLPLSVEIASSFHSSQ